MKALGTTDPIFVEELVRQLLVASARGAIMHLQRDFQLLCPCGAAVFMDELDADLFQSDEAGWWNNAGLGTARDGARCGSKRIRC
jgi:hypothetical protein